jgi:hypothetical protein
MEGAARRPTLFSASVAPAPDDLGLSCGPRGDVARAARTSFALIRRLRIY